MHKDALGLSDTGLPDELMHLACGTLLNDSRYKDVSMWVHARNELGWEMLQGNGSLHA